MNSRLGATGGIGSLTGESEGLGILGSCTNPSSDPRLSALIPTWDLDQGYCWTRRKPMQAPPTLPRRMRMLTAIALGLVGLPELHPQPRSILHRRAELRDSEPQLLSEAGLATQNRAWISAVSSRNSQSVAMKCSACGLLRRTSRHSQVRFGHFDVPPGNGGCFTDRSDRSFVADTVSPFRRTGRDGSFGAGPLPAIPLAPIPRRPGTRDASQSRIPQTRT